MLARRLQTSIVLIRHLGEIDPSPQPPPQRGEGEVWYLAKFTVRAERKRSDSCFKPSPRWRVAKRLEVPAV